VPNGKNEHLRKSDRGGKEENAESRSPNKLELRDRLLIASAISDGVPELLFTWII
jgi:hypothetical protein